MTWKPASASANASSLPPPVEDEITMIPSDGIKRIDGERDGTSRVATEKRRIATADQSHMTANGVCQFLSDGFVSVYLLYHSLRERVQLLSHQRNRQNRDLYQPAILRYHFPLLQGLFKFHKSQTTRSDQC
jgi:hypothetical protein